MEDFPAEVKEVLSADPTLAKEIEYDLRRHQEQERIRQVGFIQCCGSGIRGGSSAFSTPGSAMEKMRISNPQLC
jgi:hypothetical protein